MIVRDKSESEGLEYFKQVGSAQLGIASFVLQSIVGSVVSYQ